MKEHPLPPNATRSPNTGRFMLIKVPEVTAIFWILKVLATTVTETSADFLDIKPNLGITITSAVMAIGLAIVLVGQLRSQRYIPAIY